MKRVSPLSLTIPVGAGMRYVPRRMKPNALSCPSGQKDGYFNLNVEVSIGPTNDAKGGVKGNCRLSICLGVIL